MIARFSHLRLPDRLRMLGRGGWAIVVVLTLTVYFGYHALHGRFGLFARVDLAREITLARGELEQLRAQRLELGRRVAQLQPDSIDPDLVDEQVRNTLGFLREDEVIVLLPPAGE